MDSDASKLPMKMGLHSDYYYVGEAVAIKRTDGRTTVAIVDQIDQISGLMICHLSAGLAKNVPFHEIPQAIGKLIGYFSIEHGAPYQPKALVPGSDSSSLIRKAGLGPECYYEGEAVSIIRNDGRRTVGVILSIDFQSVAVGLGAFHKLIPSNSVSAVLSKLIGLYCISVEENANSAICPIHSAQIQDHNGNNDAGDRTRFETIDESFDACREAPKAKHVSDSCVHFKTGSLSESGGNGRLEVRKNDSPVSQPDIEQTKDSTKDSEPKAAGALKLQVSAFDGETISASERHGHCAVNPETIRRWTTFNGHEENFEGYITQIHEVWSETARKEKLPVSVSREAITLLLKMEHLAESGERQYSLREELVAEQVQAELLSLVHMFLRICLPLHILLDGQRIVAAIADRICQRTKRRLPQSIALNDFVSLFLDAFREEFCNHLSATQAMETPKRTVADGADCDNAKQIAQLSVPLTIWNAVSCFSTRQGKAGWRLARAVVAMLSRKEFECPWMSGTERGVFGETPLHVAVLFNALDPDFEDMFFFLWERCPQLQASAYQGKMAPSMASKQEVSLYEGENLLHLAVIRRFGAQFIRKLCQREDGVRSGVWTELLAGRATGRFFKDPALSGGYCNMLGELPVCFAACSNQADVFEFLLENGADARETTQEGNNVLHLIVLNDSLEKLRSEAAAGEIHVRLFRSIRGCLSDDAYKSLSEQENKDGYTPLLLAAAHGSPKMFSLLFDEEWIKAAWTYGPVTCKRMLLDGVDVPLGPPTSRRDSEAFIASEGGRRPAKKASILEELVDKGRGDVLVESHISELVEAKWRTYGDRIFRRTLLVSLLLAVAVFFLPLFKVDADPLFMAVHVGLFLVSIFVSERMFAENGEESNSALFRYLFHVDTKKEFALSAELQGAVGWICSIASVDLGDLSCQIRAAATHPPYPEEVLALFLPPILKILFFVYVGRAAVLPFIAMLIPLKTWEYYVHTAAVSVQDRSWLSVAAEALSVSLATGEAVLYCAVSLLTFANLASLVLVFERLGCFAFVLARTVRNDLPSFAAVYSLVLLAFAHVRFLASNPLHAGVAEGVDSVWRIFSAVLGEFRDENKSVCRYTTTVTVVTGVTVANYFLSTVVLVNLLIAMLGRTYDASREEVKKDWRLHRASIVVKFDRRMTANQRRAKDKLFWLSGVDGTRCGIKNDSIFKLLL